MDYKEKYKQAVERARVWKEKIGMPTDRQGILDDIFPELSESEGEGIRKALLEMVHDTTGDSLWVDYNVHKEDAIAWLEKQGEQKPAEKVEPKFKVKYAGSEYNVLEVKDIAGVTFYEIEDEPNHIDYVKADNCEIISGGYGIKENGSLYPTKPAVFSEQKPAWSDEDENAIQVLEDIVKHSNEINESIYTTPLKEKLYDWLKSLKDRVQPQPKQEWSEGDEKMLKDTIRFCELCGNKVSANWLNSLKDKYIWKPSDEQIEALDTVYKTHSADNVCRRIIFNLMNDLKKLK